MSWIVRCNLIEKQGEEQNGFNMLNNVSVFLKQNRKLTELNSIVCQQLSHLTVYQVPSFTTASFCNQASSTINTLDEKDSE